MEVRTAEQREAAQRTRVCVIVASCAEANAHRDLYCVLVTRDGGEEGREMKTRVYDERERGEEEVHTI